MVAIAQLVESRIVIPVVEGSSPSSHPILSTDFAGVAKLVDAPDLGSGAYGVRVRVSSPAPSFDGYPQNLFLNYPNLYHLTI